MRRTSSFHASLSVLICVQVAWSNAATAQEDVDQASAEEASTGKKKKTNFLVLPVPFSDPSTGTGVALGGVVFYNPNEGEHQWTSGLGGVWTTRGSRGVALFHKMYSADDRFRLNANLSYFNNDDRYYGIGADDGDRNVALQLNARQFKLKVRGLWDITESTYLGVQYLLLVNDSVPDADEEPPIEPPPQDELESTMSVIGPVTAYDTRDNHDQPHDGVYIGAAWLFGSEALGDSFSHNTLTLQANTYHSLGKDTVLAGRASFCATGGDAAYYALCRYGSNDSLRGFPSDRYRDRASWTVQGEIRHQFDHRWGGAAFFGVGGIAPAAENVFSESNLLPAGGVGVRYRLFKDNDVRMRLDFAVGSKDANGVYLNIGEAF